MLNLAQIQNQVKLSPAAIALAAPEPRRTIGTPQDSQVMTALYAGLKALGWQSTYQTHPADRVAILTLDGAELRRNPRCTPGAWIVQIAGVEHELTGSPAEITETVRTLIQAGNSRGGSAAAQIAADLRSEYPSLAGRIEKALALVEAGAVQFPQYGTRYFISNGNSVMRQCDCPDATHRPHLTAFGAGCKHCLAQEIKYRLDREAKAVTVRKLTDLIERDRARLRANAAAYQCAGQPDPLNRQKDNRRIFYGDRR